MAGGESTSAPTPSNARRVALVALGALVLGGGGVAAWRWHEKEAASLAGRWRASVGRRGATNARDGEVVIVTIEQSGASLRLASSAVDIERDPDWQNYRDYWQQKKGQPLNRVFYRGEGVIQSDERRGRRRRAARAAPDPALGPRRRSRGRRSDRHRRAARRDRSRRQAHPRSPLAQQRAGRARRRPAPRALTARQRQCATATVLARATGAAGVGNLASAAPAVPSTGRCFSRHSGMPPRNQ